MRKEGDPATGDVAVDEAYDGSGETYNFYFSQFGRDSLDGMGLPLVSSVHYGNAHNNAYWTGVQMLYGDGDGQIFKRFTASLDVIAHELTHGVISYECDLVYRNQPGALNEHFADVFGSMVRQFALGQDVHTADWLIGADILFQTATRKALRSMGAPGTAFINDPDLGTDPQPDHIRNLYTGTADQGGVHINSGIPNHAFYLACMSHGGHSWGPIGQIWYETMQALHRTSTFPDMAAMSRSIAASKFPGIAHTSVDQAWTAVGL